MTLPALPVALFAFHLWVGAAAIRESLKLARRFRAQPFLEREGDFPRAATDTSITVIIPARNEEATLAACVRAALAQRVPLLQVVVVDDHSEDGTLAVASAIAREDPRLSVVRAAELPAGWTGKSHALHQGVGVATGEWLLFTDADVVLAPEALATALAFAEAQRLDLLSLSPRQRCDGFWERLIQPLVFRLLTERFDMRSVNDPAATAAAANGQFILIRWAAYLRVGGHAAVSGEILEDVALARRAKRAGLRVYFANTRSLAEARMYRGLAAIWEGWRKNLFDLLDSSPRAAATVALRELLLWAAPFATFPLSLALSAYNTSVGLPVVVTGALALVCALASSAYLRWLADAFPRYALLLPIGTVMLVSMLVASWYRRAVRRRVVWKGRTYKA
ncbi:MAG: glycosyltransferase [Candidatus Rokubacteria bacterium]|nr:glycosyltransferase [Candidatus Rokubacteria bacterium]